MRTSCGRACAIEADENEAENRTRLEEILPGSVWYLIAEHLGKTDDLFAFASTCRYFREMQQQVVAVNDKMKLRTNLKRGKFVRLKRRETIDIPLSEEYLKWCYCHDCHNKREQIHKRRRILVHLTAQNGHLDALKWMRSKGCALDTASTSFAAEGGHLEILKYLKNQKFPMTRWTCGTAAYGGHLEILKWLRAEGCEWDEIRIVSDAARGGHIAILEWLRAQGCELRVHTAALAAREGRLQVLQWLRSQDPPCPWDEMTCAYAAEKGHVDVLQWLRDQGCPWDEHKCELLARAGQHTGVLQWIRRQTNDDA